ncbi:MAG: hypothetical protein HY376_00415 [Candidatus Blackburnbacteria bacterium]|nr:hypothetical protein [Candidatus Blackburnbacteria bacterium]
MGKFVIDIEAAEARDWNRKKASVKVSRIGILSTNQSYTNFYEGVKYQ